ncbi:MAG: helix-turn-helix domain-containing protein [Pelagimonas sp.]|jgi:transcriptional regulator GlxA family with amidase domain|nr:helix-turn-helix domain-containing protein [Pelagimonas sp.]
MNAQISPKTLTDESTPERVLVDVIIAQGFVLTEVAAIVDTLRIANRVTSEPRFEWRFCSVDGGLKASPAGAFLKTEKISQRPDAHYVFIVGNADADHPQLSLSSAIKTYAFRGARVFALAEAAGRYIKDAGLFEDEHTTHWENTLLLREQLGAFDPKNAIASANGQIVTCAGMSATVDVVLTLVGKHLSAAAKLTVADILLHEKIRDFDTQQPYGGASSNTTGDPEFDQCIGIMQANMEDPLPISEIVSVLGISNRSLERKFRSYLSTTPNTFYRELRLSKANNLLLNTNMSVREVGLACGFASGFSALYKSFFGVTPGAMRRERRKGAVSSEIGII